MDGDRHGAPARSSPLTPSTFSAPGERSIVRPVKYLASLTLIGSLAFFSSLASAADSSEGDAPAASEKGADKADSKGDAAGEGDEGTSGGDGEKSGADADKAEAKGADSKSANSKEPSYGHGKQFGLRVALVVPYRMILRYDSSPYCHAWMPDKSANDQPKFCGFGGPLAIDLALSGALIDSFEPYLWARFGLAEEEETNTAPQMIFGIGARLYTMADSAFKIFVEPAIGVEVEGKGGSTDPRLTSKLWRTDLVFHFAAGPHFDLHKNFGLYADAGLTVGVLRALSASLEGKIGVQGRLP